MVLGGTEEFAVGVSSANRTLRTSFRDEPHQSTMYDWLYIELALKTKPPEIKFSSVVCQPISIARTFFVDFGMSVVKS
jgi:hypothetical protein